VCCGGQSSEAGIETTELCEGGSGDSFPEPTIRFGGTKSDGFRASAITIQHGMGVSELRRYYVVQDDELVWPHREMTPRPQISSKLRAILTAGMSTRSGDAIVRGDFTARPTLVVVVVVILFLRVERRNFSHLSSPSARGSRDGTVSDSFRESTPRIEAPRRTLSARVST
jgi:hypothetical protein